MLSKLLLGWFAVFLVQIHASFPPLIPMGVPTPNGDVIQISDQHPQPRQQPIHLEVHADSTKELDLTGDHPILRKPLILSVQQLHDQPHSTTSTTTSTTASSQGRLVKPAKIEEEKRYLTEEEPPREYQEAAYPLHHVVEADATHTLPDISPSNLPPNYLDHARTAITRAEASLEKLDKVRFELERELEKVTDMRHRLHTRILSSQIQQEMASAGLHSNYPHHLLPNPEKESDDLTPHEKHLHKKHVEEDDEEDKAKKKTSDEDDEDDEEPPKKRVGVESAEGKDEENSKKKLNAKASKEEDDEDDDEGTTKLDPKEVSKSTVTTPKSEETSKSKDEEAAKQSLPETSKTTETAPNPEETSKSKDEEDFFFMEKKSKTKSAKSATVRNHSKKDHKKVKKFEKDDFLALMADHPSPPSFEIPRSLPLAPSSMVADFNATAFEKELDAILQHSKETHAASS